MQADIFNKLKVIKDQIPIRPLTGGKLGGDEHWLSYTGFYTRSTLYRLLIPLAVFKLMQRQLTIFDLDLVPAFKIQYSLAKTLYFTFSGDFDLAKISFILYSPEKSSALNDGNRPPEKTKQGIETRLLDNLLEALIKDTPPNSPVRLLSFGEFEKKFFIPALNEPFKESTYLFLNFHPKHRPILWRILIAQAHIYKAIIDNQQAKSDDYLALFKPFKVMSMEERHSFDWRQNQQDATDNEVFIKPFQDVENYLRWFWDSWGRILSIS